MNYHEKIIGDIECHDVEGISECFKNGVDPNELLRGEPLIYELTSEYGRTTAFTACVKAFVQAGLKFDDTILLAVLVDDGIALDVMIHEDKSILTRKYSLRCAYTPLHEVTLLHICAEYNLPKCAAVLIEYGADIDARAGTDEFGFGGHTPIFHTVNQNKNNSAEVMDLLLKQKCKLDITVSGLIWGRGYPWETFIPSVNPISYAMMGLLPQFHRKEKTIADTVSRLMKAAYGIDYIEKNIPNKYLL